MLVSVTPCTTVAVPDWVTDLPPVVQTIALAKISDQEQGKAKGGDGVQDPKAAQAEERHKKDLENDEALGKEVAAEVDKELKKSKSQQFSDRVNRIGTELSAIANVTQPTVLWGDNRINPFHYSFTVLEGDDVNAFTLPGGYVYVYEGLMKYVETDDELAGVIGHEIAHAALRHVAVLQREQSRIDAVTLPIILISLMSRSESGMGIAAAGQLTSQAIGSGWSVKAEQSADAGGFQYLLKSNFNPVGMLTFLERLAYDDRSKPQYDWGIYRTHPPNKERAVAIMRSLIRNNIPIRRSVVSTSFRALLIEELDNTFSIKFGSQKIVTLAGEGARDRANAAILSLNDVADQVPRLFEIESRDNTLVGINQTIVKLTQEDADHAKTDLATLTAQSLKNLKAAMFELGYRVTLTN